MLAAVAERLKGCLRESDTAARLGGDEFAMLLEDAADASEAVGVAERFLAHMRASLEIRGHRLSQAVSVSIAVGSEEQPEELVWAADQAMYWAKRTGKAHSAVFEPGA